MAIFRLAGGMLWLAVHFFPSLSFDWLSLTACLVFLAYGTVLLIYGWTARPGFQLCPLLIDAVFLALILAYGPDPAAWVSSVLYAHLLLASLLLYPWWNTWLITAAGALFLLLAQLPGKGFLVRLAMWSVLWSWPVALYKRRCELSQAGLQQRLAESEQQLRKVQDAERQRIAADFHDGPLQAYIALQLRLEVLGRLMMRNASAAWQELQEILNLHKSQVAQMRAFLRSMRAVQVRSGGLAASLRELVAEFQKNSGIHTSFDHAEAVEPPSVEVATELTQIVREALNNIQKHSRATRAVVTLKPARNAIELHVEDNGQGFPFSGVFDLEELERLGTGPASIQRRVRKLKGEMVLESQPRLGSRIRMRIRV
ncbi:MAG: sensor histidine kinase [Bryobacteraceae bacterium]